MSFLAPLALLGGLLGALAVLGVHLLTTERPPRSILPTARFVPPSEARAVARSRRPTDLLLMALRALVVLLVGAAFARPVFDAPGPRIRSVVLLDVSGGVADPEASRRRAADELGEGGALVLFDTAARLLAPESLATFAVTAGMRPAVGTLSPALTLARRAAGEVARGADSLRLVIISPLAEGALDAATASLRAAWPGRAELVRVLAIADTAAGPPPEVVGFPADDPLLAALGRLRAGRGRHPVRLLRRLPTPADSTWGRVAGRVLVNWQVVVGPVSADAVWASASGGDALVAPLARGRIPVDGRDIARFRDGTRAAAEAPLGDGCVRTVGVGLSIPGDMTLRPVFHHWLDAMLEPCGGRRGPPLPDSVASWIAGSGPLAPARRLATAGAADARIPAWLLVAALVLLTGEWVLRRRVGR